MASLHSINSSPDFSGENGIHGNDEASYIGTLDVYVHQARDIQNICIYHKQDVYAKLYLTSHPETTISTKIINGGGQNPVFDDFVRLSVSTLDSSLRCEVWMLSRVKNYLEDQLLGFALVPLSDILVGSQPQPQPQPQPQEFSLSSSDLFHSPSGYVQLSISYSGAQPDVYAIPNPRRASLAANTVMQDSDRLTGDYDKIEFPDPNVVTENHMMVSQYFGLDSQSSDADDSSAGVVGVHVVESFSEPSLSSTDVTNKDTPASSFSTNESPTASLPASSQSFSGSPGASKSSSQELVSPLREKHVDPLKDNDENGISNGKPSNKSGHSVFDVNIVPEKTVVQQEIVDMYLKSMQQFTESLAKMKLPMDIENVSIESGNSNGSTEPTPKSTGSRVFYGSRAFF